ncbi:hypothetical protein HS041_12405 [Planomonospora sp. ID67723]|uniref:hypothetical protein n=1 Tax=Planomonospora sp. ID67723 TaxID=2738134 RepID=UPI0018C37B9F|nr:hypothetical protein [Planomonospora sp. ID67723]MBG0828571.1 hypothetical protein [Planomonospora sp. ID67723]
MQISKYWKSVLATLGATVVAAEAIVDDSVVTDNEWVNLGIAALTAVGVYLVPNKNDGRTPGYRGDHGAPY